MMIRTPPGFTIIDEGRTKLVVPLSSLRTNAPERVPAFFNPRGSNVRDISSLAYAAYSSGRSGRVYCDPMAGVGARALRTIVEAPGVTRAMINDLNPTAINAARVAASLNGVLNRIDFSVSGATAFLERVASQQERPDIMDIDPFGSPTNLVEPALRALKENSLISITATDTAPLSGLYRAVAFRKYFGFSNRTDYSRELALRLLCSMAIRRAMSLDGFLEPVFVHSDQHYMRCYFIYRKGAEEGNMSLRRFGYVSHCPSCGQRESSDIPKTSCRVCGKSMKYSGLTWLGRLFNPDFVAYMLSQIRERRQEKYRKLLQTAAEELSEPPYYFRLPDLADSLGIMSASPSLVVKELKGAGWRASLTSIDSQGVRTDADITEVKRALRSLSPVET
jgi:tRNA (guanine26-N2/guanine27-N2)-dimethyltransferase